MSTETITTDMTMQEIISRFPSAKRALFQRYHVGGCSSCAFEPSDTLEKVCKDHNLLDVNGVVEHLMNSHLLDAKMQVEPSIVKEWVDAGEAMRFIDVRPAEERALARIEAAEELDFTNNQKYMELPKDTKFVFHCHDGTRSLDVAAYFAGHGFTEVYSMRGGIQVWSEQVDAAIPTYEAASEGQF